MSEQTEALRLADVLEDQVDGYGAWDRQQIALAAAELRRLQADNEELRKDAERLYTIYLSINNDGSAWWLPDWCILEGQVPPTFEQMRSQIDAERVAIDAAIAKQK